VSGFKRISILKDLGVPINSQNHRREGIGDLQLFSSSLRESLTTRGFNAVDASLLKN
jgi:hypothetical protein